MAKQIHIRLTAGYGMGQITTSGGPAWQIAGSDSRWIQYVEYYGVSIKNIHWLIDFKNRKTT